MSFLPHDGGTYQQAPYESAIDKAQYNQLMLCSEPIRWDELPAVRARGHQAGRQAHRPVKVTKCAL